MKKNSSSYEEYKLDDFYIWAKKRVCILQIWSRQIDVVTRNTSWNLIQCFSWCSPDDQELSGWLSIVHGEILRKDKHDCRFLKVQRRWSDSAMPFLECALHSSSNIPRAKALLCVNEVPSGQLQTACWRCEYKMVLAFETSCSNSSEDHAGQRHT